jgi:hypothetical protein
MPVTLAQARVALRERLDEYSARQWTDNMLDRWLHEGAKDIARRAEVLQDTATIAAVAGTQAYTLPDDMVRIYRLAFNATGDPTSYPLEARDFKTADAVWWTQQAVTQGTPALFTMWGVPGSVQAILYPTPAVGGTLTAHYYRLPLKAVDDTDELDLPEGWEDCAYAFAEHLALRQDRDQRWQESKAMYEELLSELVRLTQHHTDQPSNPMVGGLPMVNGWLYEFD